MIWVDVNRLRQTSLRNLKMLVKCHYRKMQLPMLKITPKVGAIVNTPEGRGLVVENNLIARTLKVKLDSAPKDVAPKSFTVRQCKLVKDGYIKVNKKELEQLGNLE